MSYCPVFTIELTLDEWSELGNALRDRKKILQERRNVFQRVVNDSSRKKERKEYIELVSSDEAAIKVIDGINEKRFEK